MHALYGSPRSTESPMDFEYTSRPRTKPAWATAPADDGPHTPRKRTSRALSLRRTC